MSGGAIDMSNDKHMYSLKADLFDLQKHAKWASTHLETKGAMTPSLDAIEEQLQAIESLIAMARAEMKRLSV